MLLGRGGGGVWLLLWRGGCGGEKMVGCAAVGFAMLAAVIMMGAFIIVDACGSESEK